MRVWTKGKEKRFKLVVIPVDEKLKWDKHINNVARKMDYALYGLSKVSKQLSFLNKELLFFSSLVFPSALTLGIWGDLPGIVTWGAFTTPGTGAPITGPP